MTRTAGPVDVHHVVTGPEDAPVAVLSNSLGSTYAMWDAQADALAERFRVVRYDTRGHGRSPVPPGPDDIRRLPEDPDYTATVLWTSTLGTMHVARLGIGVRQLGPGVPGVFRVSSERVVQTCVENALAAVRATS